MEYCEKHSKKICAYCKHYDYCDAPTVATEGVMSAA